MDIAYLLDHARLHLAKKLPFVLYRKPEEKQIKGIFQETDAITYIEDFTESGFVFAPFGSQEKPVLIQGENYVVPFEDVPTLETTPSYVFMEQEEAQKAHMALVEKGIKTIRQTELKKVVLSRKQHLPQNSFDALSFFKTSAQKYPNAFAYVWFHPKVGLWLGASPETLVRVAGNQFETMALAGTQPYRESISVIWGSKEQEEQQMVVDELKSRLEVLHIPLQVAKTETHKAGNLLHLKTKIKGRLTPAISVAHIIESLHPTAAVCGLPRDIAQDFIIANENYDREYYTGYLGELNVIAERSRNTNSHNVENNAYRSVKKTTHLFVNLRCLKAIENELHLFVGGGITSNSIPEAEWEETVNKAQTMASLLHKI